ncbi:hypothetical protein GHT06_003875 [Daphnia sinensis]|uniref:Glycoside-hydrolase family GH114 TIM-barrel domain-containing protein n=1 Tax=Daphnia sinensis TaxID=1820382 RepID=A0AAD5PM36_9CRUS|nr:hypothetical protein GHT06_003875 [Daphnia sinensis]
MDKTPQFEHYRTRADELYCYVSAGTAEKWRADFSAIPDRVLNGNTYPGEYSIGAAHWRDPELQRVMRERVCRAKAMGCDGIEFDNIDCYVRPSKCEGTRLDQIEYIRWLGATARAHGLRVGCKNVGPIIQGVRDTCDFYVAENCGRCPDYDQDSSKLLFIVNYNQPCDGAALCKECWNSIPHARRSALPRPVRGRIWPLHKKRKRNP